MTHINQRRDLAATWIQINPVLELGEVGWETDSKRSKLGDGTTAWNNLPYATTTPADVAAAAAAKADTASPTFSGTPTAPTPATATNDTTIATTAYAKSAIRGGSVIALGNISGSVNLSTVASGALTASSAVNAVVTATLTGNTTFTAATMPAAVAGTQFVMRITHGPGGGYNLTLSNIRKPGGSLALSGGDGDVDLVVFFYDGSNWYATPSGLGFAS